MIKATYKVKGEFDWGGHPVKYYCTIGDPESITWSRSSEGLGEDPEVREMIHSLCYDDALAQYNEWMTEQAKAWLKGSVL